MPDWIASPYTLNILLGAAAIWAFFFKESSNTYQRYYEYKLAKCADAALTAAQIANTDDGDELKLALCRFDELYYGHLILFESRDLAGQMMEFRSLFANKDQDFDVAKILEKKRSNIVEVRQAALRLAAQCRRAVRPTLFALIYDRIFPVRQ